MPDMNQYLFDKYAFSGAAPGVGVAQKQVVANKAAGNAAWSAQQQQAAAKRAQDEARAQAYGRQSQAITDQYRAEAQKNMGRSLGGKPAAANAWARSNLGWGPRGAGAGSVSARGVGVGGTSSTYGVQSQQRPVVAALQASASPFAGRLAYGGPDLASLGAIKTAPQAADPWAMPGSLSPRGGVAGGFATKLTAYSPQTNASKKGALGLMEGGVEQSWGHGKNIPGLRFDARGNPLVNTFDYYLKNPAQARFVTVAGDPKQAGQRYTIPQLQWRNPETNAVETHKNIPVLVGDTGGAFKRAGTSHFDFPIGINHGNRMMNSQPFLSGGVRFTPGWGAAQPTKSRPLRGGFGGAAPISGLGFNRRG